MIDYGGAVVASCGGAAEGEEVMIRSPRRGSIVKSDDAYPYPSQVKLVQAPHEKKTCDEAENTGRVGQPSNFGLALNYEFSTYCVA